MLLERQRSDEFRDTVCVGVSFLVHVIFISAIGSSDFTDTGGSRLEVLSDLGDEEERGEEEGGSDFAEGCEEGVTSFGEVQEGRG